MRFKRHLELEYGLRQIITVPLINMFFLLLIFFMLTPSFVLQPGIKVNLPKVVTSEAVRPDNIEIAISDDNIIYVDRKAVTNQELKRLLVQVAKRKITVLINADRGASLGRVVEIWDMCRDLSVSQVNIATSQK